MRYVNCATSKSVQNVKAFQFSGGIYYRACVDIPVNVEMVVWYGEEYAEELGLLAKQTKSLGKFTMLKTHFCQIMLALICVLSSCASKRCCVHSMNINCDSFYWKINIFV